MKILIFGSTGATGTALVRQGLERGHEVFAFARNPEQIGLSDARLRLVRGDVLDAHAVSGAVKGMDAAISALGVRIGEPVSTVRSVGTRNIVEALEGASVYRFVSVSTVGAGAHLNTLPWIARVLLPRVVGRWRLQEAGLQEDAIRSSRLGWTVLRPPRLVDGQADGKYRIGETLATGFGAKLTRGNLAAALLDQLETNRFLNKAATVSD